MIPSPIYRRKTAFVDKSNSDIWIGAPSVFAFTNAAELAVIYSVFDLAFVKTQPLGAIYLTTLREMENSNNNWFLKICAYPGFAKWA